MDEFEAQERIEAYWCDKMSPEERAAFERQMQSDPALAQQVEDWRLVFLATDRLTQKDLQMNFARWKGEMDQPVAPQQNPALKRTVVIGLFMFLVVLVMIGWGAILFFKTTEPVGNRSSADAIETETQEEGDANSKANTNTKINSKSNTTSPDDQHRMAIARQEQGLLLSGVVTRSVRGYDVAMTSLEKGREALSKGQAQRALEELNKIEAADPDYSDALYLRGHAQFILGDYELAAANFRHFLSLIFPDDLVEYNLLLTYLAAGKSHDQDFRQLLEKIKKDKEHTYYDKVIDLEGKL